MSLCPGCWVSPRLLQLKKAFPDIDFDLISTDDPESYLDQSIDISITHGLGKWPGYQATLLCTEEVIPVCSPDYLNKSGPIRTLKDLSDADLIDLIYEKWTWMNWTIWLAESGIPFSGLKRVFRSNLYDATIKAARDGMGIALGWRHFVDPYLLNQELVAPLDIHVTTANGYYLLLPEHSVNNPQTARVCQWIKNEFSNQPLFILP